MSAVGSALGLWRHLVERAGLEPASWDEDLAGALLGELGEDPEADLETVLAGGVSVERFVTALFRVLEPYGQMLGDLLELFAAHNVRQADEIVEVEFDFDTDRDPLRFDLEAFRAARELLRQVAVWGPPWDRDAWWALFRALAPDAPAFGDEPLAWQDDHIEAGRWPPPDAGLARSGDPRLDRWLEHVEVVWRWTRDASAAAAPDRDALRDRWGDDEWTETLAWINSDYWLVQVAQGAEAVARSGDASTSAARLQAFFDRHPFRPPSVEQSVRVLEDLLALPIFAARHELYGAWVLREIVDAIPAEVVLCARDGVLRFPFKPTVMAEAAACEPPLAVWSELRSELADPIGASRTGAVQPDFSIVGGERTEDPAGASTMEIECKQYRRPKYADFGAALRDYAKARPDALVVLVDNGPLRESTLLAKVPVEFRHRTRAIGELHPPRADRRAEFARLVHDRTADLCPPPGPWLEVRLAWDAPPSDLDLHAYVTEASGRHHIRYNARGDAERHPFVHLSEDVTSPGGEERLTAERRVEGATYLVSVHAFTTDAPLAGCGARATLRLGRDEHVLTCPAAGRGRLWDLAEIEATGEVRIIDVLREGEP